MSDDNASTATRVYLDSGQFVRVSETIGQVVMLMDGVDPSGFIPVCDPGDARDKLIRAHRIIWIEEEAESDR